MKLLTTGISVALVSICLVLTGCDVSQTEESAKNTQADKAAAAANSITFTDNAEINNIKDRITLTSKPGLLGYVAIINKVGSVVMYTPVRGKITSGNKRLTKPWELHRTDCGPNYCVNTTEAPSDEGTYGSSNPYIYFWTPTGRYVQTSMEYIYSDQPLRLDGSTVAIDLITKP